MKLLVAGSHTDCTGVVLNEYFSGFRNIGHNDAMTIIFLWIIPK